MANKKVSIIKGVDGVSYDIDALTLSGKTYAEIVELINAVTNGAVVLKGTLGTGGTVTTLETAAAANCGHAYKVITDGTYASQAAKVGDLFICYKSGTSSYAWMLIPAGDDLDDTWRPVKVNGTQAIANGITSGALNLKSGNNIEVTASGNDVTFNLVNELPNARLPRRLQEYSSSGYSDANEATMQGWHYMTSIATNRPPFKQVDGVTGNDYRIMTTAYSSAWVQQIATDFRSNDIFTRNNINGSWQPWTAVVKLQRCGTDHSMPTITDNAIPRWDTTRNATLQNSGIIIDDSNNLTAPGNITLYKASGDSPKLIFLRGTTNDSQNDWAVFDNGGSLHFENRGSDNTWTRNITLLQDGGITLLRNGQIKKTNTAGTTTYSYTLPDANGTLATQDWVTAQLGSGGSHDLSNYVKGPSSATDTAIALYDGTTGKKIKNSGATIDANRNLKFNGPGNISWEDGSYHQRIQITDDSTQNTAVFTFQQTEDTGKTWSDLFTIQDRGTIVAKNSTGGALSLTLDRGSNANWRWLSDNGNFIGQCDYTDKKGSYFNVLTMAYNTGNVSVDKGTLTSKGGFIHGNLTVPTGKSKNDYVLLAGGGAKILSDLGAVNITDLRSV